MKRFLAVLIALLFTVQPVFAIGYPAGRQQATIAHTYDVADTSYHYVVFGDKNSQAVPVGNEGTTGWVGPGTAVNIKIKTTGSSANVVAVTAATAPFRGLAAGDLIIVQAPDTGSVVPGTLVEYERVITTFTDADTIVVDTALDLSAGYTFRFKKLIDSTNANGGWFSVNGFDDFNIQADVLTFNVATSIDFKLECRVSKFSAANTIDTNSFTAASTSHAISVSTRQDQCRVGLKITGADTGTNNVSVRFIGAK